MNEMKKLLLISALLLVASNGWSEVVNPKTHGEACFVAKKNEPQLEDYCEVGDIIFGELSNITIVTYCSFDEEIVNLGKYPEWYLCRMVEKRKYRD